MNRILSQLIAVYKPRYIILNVAFAALYYIIFTALLSFQQQGMTAVFFPYYFIYILVITSSIVLTIAVYSIKNTRNNSAKVSATTAGTVTTLAGTVISGCGCSASVLFGLAAVGVSSSQIFAINDFLTANQPLLLSAMIAINLFVIIYYLNKLSKPSCRIRKR
jgi:uncharacterized membrane protein